MTRTRDIRAFRHLVWLTIGLGLCAVAATVATIVGLRADAFDSAAREEADLAIVLGRDISESNRDINAILEDVVRIVEATNPRSSVDFQQSLRTASVSRQLLEQIATARVDEINVVDDIGNALSVSLTNGLQETNVLHEGNFIYVSEHDSAYTYISLSFLNLPSERKSIYFNRRINGPDGKFLGIAQVGMTLEYYYSIYTTISALKGKAVMLARSDGSVLFRFPEVASGTREQLPANSPWHAAVAAGGGVYRSSGYFDDQRRVVVVHPLDDYPLVVSVSEPEDAVLALWRARGLQIGFGAFLAFLCAGFLMKATYKQFQRLLGSESSLAKKREELEAVNARFALALGSLPQGVALFGKDQKLIIANRRYREIYQLPPEEVNPGDSVADILARRVAHGIYVDSAERYVQTRLAEILSPTPHQILNRLSNGQVILVSHQPMTDGGFMGVHDDITARQRAEDQIEHLALHDQLTGAANRFKLLREMERRLPGAAADGAGLAVLLLDLDEFKAVNDTYGHPLGDALLRAVAGRLRDAAGERDLVARTGGDEFAILAAATGVGADAYSGLAQRLLEAIRVPFEIDGYFLSVRPSIGCAIAPLHGTDVEILMKSADLALYRAKSDGRDRIRYFDASLEVEIRAQRALKADLAAAVALGQFEVHYQPIVDAGSGRVVDVEALARWRHPVRGMVPPDEFIKLAERTGQIKAIGEFVLRTACREAAGWPASINVSVNLSAAQFGRGNLVAAISSALADTGLAPHRLTLEVTETALMENVESSLEALEAIRAIGVRIALDDFGTGYSSLSYLQTFPLNSIKIDRSFVAAMETNSRTQDIVALIAAIAKRLGATTIAEGVETQAQFDLVRAAGCDLAQGYLFSRPVPIENLQFEPARGDEQRAA